jgi:hypothetical protein
VNLLQVNLTNIVVREFAQSANKSEASEVVLLDFDVVEWVYTQIDPAGSPTGQIRSYWDEVTGTGAAFDDSDTDGDGMPNAFEALFGLNSAENDADADLDGDGASNLLEYRAGTAPNRKDSVLRVTGRRLDGRRVQVDWTPVSGRTYKLLAAPAVEGPYSELGPVDPTAGGRLVFDASRLRQFFLIKSN